MRRTDVSRFAVEFYLRNYRVAELDQRETSLERRIRAMEDHIQNLVLKSIRISGQALYFSMLPFVNGMPQQQIAEEALQNHCLRSIEYAASFMKSQSEAGRKTQRSDNSARDQADLVLSQQKAPA